MASSDAHDQRVDLLGTVQVLHEYLTVSMCQTVFVQTPHDRTCPKMDLGGIGGVLDGGDPYQGLEDGS